VKIADNQTFRHADSLADLPIDVAEAMYSPDFVELSSLSAGGTPLSLPMSFTLDIAGNCVRFSSPLTAGRLANYARDPRCSVLFSRVTTGHPPVMLQGVVTLGEVAEGVRRGPARRFTVTPERLCVLGEEVDVWHFPPVPRPAAGDTVPAPSARPQPPAAVTADDLAILVRQPSTIVTLRDADGRPVALPVELNRRDTVLTAGLPDLGDAAPTPGRASVLGHTWTKEGPRYIALTGRAALDGASMTFVPARTMRRGL
jgi:hypothetical protein